MKDNLYSDGGPVPTSPVDFAAEAQVIVLDPLVTSAAALDVQLGQLALAYADRVIPGGLHLRYGPWAVAIEGDDCWPHPASPEEIERTGVDVRQPDGVSLDRDDPWAVAE